MSTPDPRLLARFRDALNAGRDGDANAVAETILAQAPGHAPTLVALSMRARLRGDFAHAKSLALRGLQRNPGSSSLLFHLGAAATDEGALPEAGKALRAAIHADPSNVLARFWLGDVLRRQGQTGEAVSVWLHALANGEHSGFLQAMATGPLEVRERIAAAQAAVHATRSQFIDNALHPFRERHGGNSVARIDNAFAGYRGGAAPQPMDPMQSPGFLFVPGLSNKPWWEPAEFPFLAKIEAQTDVIRNELLQVLADEEGLVPYVDDEIAEPIWRTLNHSPSWSGYHFYRYGERIEAHARRCPRTMAVLDALPLPRIPGRPEVLFSVLRPGTHIPPHTGVMNARLTVHLPLIVPPACGALTVARESRSWAEGECLVFDDSFVHEAWNRSAHTRVVLIFDVWNPDLSPTERDALSAGMSAISEFHRRHGGADPTREPGQ